MHCVRQPPSFPKVDIQLETLQAQVQRREEEIERLGHLLEGGTATSMIFWDHFSRVTSSIPRPHAPCDVLYLVPMIMGC